MTAAAALEPVLVMLLLVGVGLETRGLFDEGTSYEDGVLAQTGRRPTRLDMTSFSVAAEQGRRDWRNTLLAIEQRVVSHSADPA